ncbi:hypothetical protein [Streptomyces sp. SID12501]
MPSWVTGGFTVTVNGVPQSAGAAPGLPHPEQELAAR